MQQGTTPAQAIMKALGRGELGAPLLLLIIIGMMIVPMAPVLLDLLFSFNIALSVAILLAVIYASRPLDLTAFPTILLVVTLLRLALNVASTRVVLLNGHDGGDAAGRVIEAFGTFVIGGNYAVGLVVFVILTIINFVVVTKGAERISEVSARFTLDAMPGKQMAIDADLGAGLMTAAEAKVKRSEVAQEADFYGSMDGASKFVRGDAIAGLLILFINLLGGLAIGMAQHGLSFGQAAETYSLLTIGDGLVAQIPALLLSIGVAILVTRMSSPQNMSEEMATQLFASPQALLVTAGILGLIGMIPGMPNMPFLTLAAIAGGTAYWMTRRKLNAENTARQIAEEAPVDEQPRLELGWDDVPVDEPLVLELGYRLIPIVDEAQGGTLLGRVKGVRKKLTHELGFLVPAVHIRDDLEIAPTAYRLKIFGTTMGQGELRPGMDMALSTGGQPLRLPGTPTKDPVFGLDAWWILPEQREQVVAGGNTVVDGPTIIATHLSQVISAHAAELLGHDEVERLLERLGAQSAKLVESLCPKPLSTAMLVRVLRNLLSENVPVRNMRLIAESLAAAAPYTQDPEALTAHVRVDLGRQITQSIAQQRTELPVMTLDPGLERTLRDAAQSDAVEPGLMASLQQRLIAEAEGLQSRGEPVALLVQGSIRRLLARLLRGAVPGLSVLAYDEIPDNQRLRVVTTL
ncbi:MAG: flagellar biosynthesis protein FlhA [Oceanococcaceae bacterium]